MTSTAALVVPSPGAPFERRVIERRDLRDDDVLIDIAFAGICHSDIHQVREEWGSRAFPMVPGHEIAGVVAAVGDGVTRYQVGDRVGVGCMVDSCGECASCKDGQEQFCAKGPVMTYASDGYDGEATLGGYAQQIVVSERFALRIPDGIGLDAAAPLLCAGITLWSPLRRWGAGPGTKVAIIGLGGLGHMGVKLAAALGADVSILSRTDAKRADGEAFGATHFHATSEAGTLKELSGAFDLIINTVSANLP
ncbi:MAG: NAD(P)-dependent alcohol dehydrogenase, partial [Dermatophilaceae bacterium]